MTDWRRRAREAALQILYQWEIGRMDVRQAAETFFTSQWPGGAAPPTELRAFAEALSRDTVADLETIDRLIAAVAEHWRPERLAVVDRLVLRMALCELRRAGQPDAPPPAVVIDEAIELARRFGTEESARFVNGLLDAARRRLELERGARGGDRER